jgi:hypothetical protein
VAQDKSDISFKVIDRRLFTEQGDLRPEAQEHVRREHEEVKPAAPVSTVAPTAASSGAASGPGAVGPGGGATVSAAKQDTAAAAAPAAEIEREAAERLPHFEMLLNLVANQAAAMLGAYADPRTGQAVVDLEGAREFIDMLDALREKTIGNLAEEEERILTEVIGSLKYTYLEMTKAAAAARAGGAGPAPGARR